jgi:hypothetical protein
MSRFKSSAFQYITKEYYINKSKGKSTLNVVETPSYSDIEIIVKSFLSWAKNNDMSSLDDVSDIF